MRTGENEQSLRQIIDLTRKISIGLMVLHFYVYCYGAFYEWGLTHHLSDRLLENARHTGLFDHSAISKAAALLFLVISLIGAKGKKDENLRARTGITYCGIGLLLFMGSFLFFLLNAGVAFIAVLYMSVTTLGYIFILSGGTLLSRLLKLKFQGDPFNKLNETFPQEERLLDTEYSVNLPARYNLKGKIRKSWINIINPFRGLLVIGTPGAGKSYFVIRHVITQHIQKGFTMFLYDFKYDDLTRIVYNTLLKNVNSYQVAPKFYVVNFDDLNYSHRCNPLDPSLLLDIADAAESSRTILLSLNREWIKKQGDFWVESAISFLTAIIWFLRKYKDGRYCTLPHVIELMQVEYDKLFTLFRTQPEVEALTSSFISAFQNSALEQLEGQIASARISMARLSTPNLYYVLSGNEFSLDINDPAAPKIVCMGNNPQKQQIYGAVLSLYTSRLVRVVNQRNKLKSSLIFDEFPTIYFNGIDGLMATARSNKVATCLGVQDYSQLRKDYGKEQADVIVNIAGNLISGQVTGDTAKQLSERFGKIIQQKENISINSMDTSISKNMQLDYAIPASKIATLSSGEFVGAVADNPEEKIELKTFHCEIINNHEEIKHEEGSYKPLPPIRSISESGIEENYYKVKFEVQQMVSKEMNRINENEGLAHLLVRKK